MLKALWLLVRRVIAPAAAVAAVMVARWCSGAPMLPGREWAFRHGLPKPVGVRVGWRYWPGWQRAIVRVAGTLVVAVGVVFPVVTVVAVLALAVGLTSAAVAVRRQQSGPIRVRAIVGGGRPAVAAGRLRLPGAAGRMLQRVGRS